MSTASNIWTTSSTGGTGDLTLSYPSSGPFMQGAQYQDYWGTGSPDPWVDYTIEEYGSPSLLSIKQYEIGCAPLHAGVTLRRTATNAKIFQTYVQGTGVTPSVAATSAPTAITFGSVAANIRITCSLHAGSVYQLPRFRNDTNVGLFANADCLGWGSANSAFVAIGNFSANTLIYNPYYIPISGLYKSASIYVVTPSSGNVARFALYHDDGSGWVGALINDWGVTAEFPLSTNGRKTTTLATPIFLSAGWYWQAFISNGSGTLSTAHLHFVNPAGTVNGAQMACGTLSQTYGAFASSGLASSGFEMVGTEVLNSVILI